MAKFQSKRTFTEGGTTVEVGTRSGHPAFKITLVAGSTFIVKADEADTLADLMDDALDAHDSDPLLWGDGSR